MKKTNIRIVRFEDGPFWVDIVDAGEAWEAWLTHNRYGVSDLMFGWPKVQHPKHLNGEAEVWDFDRFCKIVENNLEEGEADYRKEHNC
jgi:hypothetical protein